MMMVQTDKMSSSSRERAQRLYDKNVELENKRRRSAQARVPSDPNAWQQMRENYEAIILEDHNFSEQHNIEYALWQLHYRRIEEFRAHFSAALASAGSTTSQGGRSSTRPDRVTKIRLQFKTFLSEATGFYHDLILKIRAKYGLPLSYVEDSEDQIILERDGKKSIEMKKGFVSCHRCLIYLGDLARYKGLYGEGGDSKSRDYAAASSYYMQAASLWPLSGNPHHQLAILASYSGDEFATIYRYFRSLAVDSPFSTARDNLIVAFEKNRLSYSQLQGDTPPNMEVSAEASAKGRRKEDVKPESKDSKNDTRGIHEVFKAFCIRFVRLNGIIFTRTSMETFVEVLSRVSGDLHDLLSSGLNEELNFGVNASENGLFIVRLTAILIYTVFNVSREAEGQTYADILQRNVLLQNALNAAFELMGHIFKRCLELHDPFSSYLLPGILVFLEWLACYSNIAERNDVDDRQATVRSSFWNHCVLLLNKLLCFNDEDEHCFSNRSRYGEGEAGNQLALWEDFELRGFIPLQPRHSILDFSRKHSFGGDHNKEKNARVKRIIAAGKALANFVKADKKSFRYDLEVKKFVIGVEPQISNDQLIARSASPRSTRKMHDTTTEAMPGSEAQLLVEAEEEDEVIVFKPTPTEKRSDSIASKWTPHDGLEPCQNAVTIDSQFHGSAVSGPSSSNMHQQAAIDVGSQLPTSVANIVPQHLQLVEPHSSMWLLDQQSSLANGLRGVSIFENGQITKPGIRDVSTPHTAQFSSYIQRPVNADANGVSHNQEEILENLKSHIDLVSSFGANSGSLATNSSLVSAASSRKSPVIRPVRHLGPPPGFNRVPPKQANVPTIGLDTRGAHTLADDYSWLDGYQLPLPMKSSEHNQFVSSSSHTTPHYISNENGSVGTINFPFPGKQVPTMQSLVETQRGWQDHQIMERVNLNHEQQQQLIKGSQQFPTTGQYQGQSIWASRHFG